MGLTRLSSLARYRGNLSLKDWGGVVIWVCRVVVLGDSRAVVLLATRSLVLRCCLLVLLRAAMAFRASRFV